MTTLKEFVRNLEAVGREDVRKVFKTPPAGGINKSDMPCQWVEEPKIARRGVRTLNGNAIQAVLTAKLIRVYKPVPSGRAEQTWEEQLNLVDDIDADLMEEIGTICRSLINWTAEPMELVIGQQRYSGVVVDVEGNG